MSQEIQVCPALRHLLLNQTFGKGSWSTEHFAVRFDCISLSTPSTFSGIIFEGPVPSAFAQASRKTSNFPKETPKQIQFSRNTDFSSLRQKYPGTREALCAAFGHGRARGCRAWVRKRIRTDIRAKSTERAKRELTKRSGIAKKHKQKAAAKLLFESLSGLDCNV